MIHDIKKRTKILPLTNLFVYPWFKKKKKRERKRPIIIWK